MLAFFRIACRKHTKIRGRFVRIACQVRADYFPALAAINRFEHDVCGEKQFVRVRRRKHQRQSAIVAILAAPHGLRRNVLHFTNFQVRARYARAVNQILIGWIDGDRAVLFHSEQSPVAKCDFSVVAAAGCRCRSALLLCAINPVGKTVVRRNVIKLRRGLVIPTAPRRAAVYANHRALVARQSDDLSVGAIDPDSLVIVAARCALPSHKRFPTIVRFPRGCVRHINLIRIVRRHGNSHCTRAASADPAIVIDERPCFARVIRAIYSRFFVRFH